jgi:4-hydroxy-3-methylbut-2-en-1-yl diphosphate reductase
MIVRRAAVMGRCMGVRRAVDMALAAAAEEGGRGVFTLGPLIHNPQAVAELEAAGVVALSEAELDEGASGGAEISGSIVVIRAHGIAPAQRERLAALGARVVDATCPRVLASQRKAAAYAAKGWKVVIAGDLGHGEVVGIAGHAPGALVVGSPEEARALRLEGPEGSSPPIALIAQTTISEEEYGAIRSALAERFPLLEVVDSICPCTRDRLEALAQLAAEVDAIVIVGGRNSANTARLLAAARALGKPAWLVETAGELPEEAFAMGRVGISAGASTPERLINEVELALLTRSPGGLYSGSGGV